MKKLLLLIALLMPILAFSQRKKDYRSAIDFIISPEYFSPPHVEADASFNPTLGFRVGTNVNLYSTLVPHFVFRSGFRYAQFSYNIKPLFKDSTTKETYKFVEIPLVFRYYFGLNTWRLYAEAQGTVNFNFTKKNDIDNHFTVGGAIGMEYIHSRQLGFFVQPTFRKPIMPNWGLGSIKYHFNTGLEMGVKYRY